MKKTELKKILHAMIDSLTDKHILYDLEKDVFPYVINYRTKKMDEADDDLTQEQIIQLDETFSQADAGTTITLKEVTKNFATWLPDIDKQRQKDEKKILKISKKKLRKKLHTIIDEIDNKYVLNVLLDDIMPDALNTSKYE